MFDFSFNKKYLYIILGIMIVATLAKYATQEGAILNLLLTLPGVLIAITFHEFAHAFAADRLGDDTPRREGRLSLNPIDHLDPVGSVLLLFAGIGWGKPVRVNPSNYTRKMSMEKGDAIVSIAGPAMNFLLAIIFTFIYCAIFKFSGSTFIVSTTGKITTTIIYATIITNIGLGVFNLIPLPPLDGSKVIMPLLPIKAKNFFVENETVFYIIFLLIWITGIASDIIAPAIAWIGTGILKLGLLIFGL